MKLQKLIWIPRIVAAVIMLQTLFFKFSAAEESVYIFSSLEMEPWGRIGTGIGELIASVLIMIPAVSWIGAVLSAGLMSGAIFFHLTKLGIEIQNDGGLLFFYACLVLFSSVAILITDRDKWIQLLRSKRLLLIVPLIILNSESSIAQGCSDAGVCSIGASSSLKGSGTDSSNATLDQLAAINTTISVGAGEQGVLHGQLIIEPRFFITKNLDWQVRIPLVSNSGNLATVSGIGDISSALMLRLYQRKDTEVRLSAGVRIPTGETNILEQGRSLPMPYQTGLGTTDFIPAVSIRINRFSFAAAGQFILNHANENGFSTVAWQENDDAVKYFNSMKLERGHDISLRSDFQFGQDNKWLSPGILMIYRLKGDSFVNSSGIRQYAQGSEGLTVNLFATGYVRLSKKSALQAQLGFPVLIRETRPDGLTRAAVINFTHIYKIGK